MEIKFILVLSGAVHCCTENIFRFCSKQCINVNKVHLCFVPSSVMMFGKYTWVVYGEQCINLRKISIFPGSVLMSEKYI